MKTYSEFLYESWFPDLNEMTIAVGVSPHPSKSGFHVLSFKHNSSPAGQFPHERLIRSKDLASEIATIHKALGKQNVTVTHHQQ